MPDRIIIRTMEPADWKAVSEIYKEGILTGFATFETEVPSWDQWNSNHIAVCRLVAVAGKKVKGWAALSAVSSRCVYGGVAEVSVYVAKNARGKQIGEQLLRELIAQSEKEGYWTLQSGIFPENTASIGLHKKCGFRKIGFRERIAQLNGVWKDNILMEKRSEKTG
ncbi:N-acetyltransferase family protein [Lutimonas sp.]|uniref:GNAT family N-acetyltransferase n=1 Tax=Lutimonas sp. TaxID=1872403 RepID=UPI003C764CDC